MPPTYQFKLLKAASGITINTTGTNYVSGTDFNGTAKKVVINNTGGTDVYVAFDSDRINVDTSGDDAFRVINGTSKERDVYFTALSLKMASGTTTVDVEIWG